MCSCQNLSRLRPITIALVLLDMENKPVIILLIEDNNAVAELIEDMINKGGRGAFSVHRENSLDKGVGYLKSNSSDIVLLDLSLPDSKGLDTLNAVHKEALYVPIVILTGMDDTTLAVKSLRYGAQDYLIKSEVTPVLLIRAVQYAIERSRVEKALAESRDELEERVKERTAELFKANERLKEEVGERKKKQIQLEEAYAELKKTQSQLIQAAKMQVVGTLASGVAHEVKNPLAIILQGAEFLDKKIDTNDTNVMMAVTSIKDAVERADRIIRGLLDFSSISRLNTQEEDLNALIDKCFLLLKHEFDKRRVKIVKSFGKLPRVPLDRNKIEQVFINIFMNAAYAMDKEGGELSVSTRVVESNGPDTEILNESVFSNYKGSIVLIEVTDTGGGIPKDIMERAFEPFFTTKRSRGGTGLGLAIVKNIIDTHRGMVYIDNVDGRGARVRIYLRTC